CGRRGTRDSRTERRGIRLRHAARRRLAVLRGEHQVSRERVSAERQARRLVGLHGLRHGAGRRSVEFREQAIVRGLLPEGATADTLVKPVPEIPTAPASTSTTAPTSTQQPTPTPAPTPAVAAPSAAAGAQSAPQEEPKEEASDAPKEEPAKDEPEKKDSQAKA